MKTVDAHFYPGFTRKAFTFTIDDGNIPLDQKFLAIVKPNGIKGTFNLGAPMLDRYTADFYRAMYAGYEIANHCKRHPYSLDPAVEYVIAGEPFDEQTADPAKIYPTDQRGFYRFHLPNGWRIAADRETYLRMVDEGLSELEAVFGKGSVISYVWPYHMQKDPVIFEEIKKRGYKNIRKTGNVGDSTGFALPADRTQWSYNVNHVGLHEMGDLYRAYPDDGELKFFCFGLHSHDYENNHMWDVLERFAKDFGNRPEEFWYATVGEIFAYEDAVKALVITDTEVRNDSDLSLCLKVDGERVTLMPHSSYPL